MNTWEAGSAAFDNTREELHARLHASARETLEPGQRYEIRELQRYQGELFRGAWYANDTMQGLPLTVPAQPAYASLTDTYFCGRFVAA